MFGNSMKISCNGLSLLLRPPKESDIPSFVDGISDWEVKKHLGFMGGVTIDSEKEWIKRTTDDESSMIWFVQPEGLDHAIASTGLHYLNNPWGTCRSGFVIWDKSWWRKGVASLAHIARTWIAAKQLCRFTISSEVDTPNIASWKALEKVGYIRIGTEPRCRFSDGKFIDKYYYVWLNPLTLSITFPEGVPNQYNEGIEKAKCTIQKGDELIKYI